MTPRPLPRPLPRATSWIVPGGLAALCVTAGIMSVDGTAVIPDAVGAPPLVPLETVPYALAVGALLGTLVLAAWSPGGAAAVAVAAALYLLLDLPAWVAVGVALAAIVALVLRSLRSVTARATATWSAGLVDAPPVDVVDELPARTVRGRLAGLGLLAAGAVLVVGGIVWTATDAVAVATFRERAVLVQGIVTATDTETYVMTVETPAGPVHVPEGELTPRVGAEVTVRLDPDGTRAELAGDPFDPAGALVWSGLGAVLLVTHRIRRARILGARPLPEGALFALLVHGTVDDEGVALHDDHGRTLARLVDVRLLGDVAGLAVPEPVQEDEEEEIDLTQLADGEVVALLRQAREAAVAAELEEAGVTVVDLPAVLGRRPTVAVVAGPGGPTSVAADGSVLARVGTVWTVGRLTSASVGAAGVSASGVARSGIAPSDVAPSGSAPADAASQNPHASEGGSSSRPGPAAPSAPGQGRGMRGLRRTMVAWLARTDGLPLLVAHGLGAALVWWLITGEQVGWWRVGQLVLVVGSALWATSVPEALARVTPTHLVVRGPLLHQVVPWRDVDTVTRADGAGLVRYRHGSEEHVLMLDAVEGAAYRLVVGVPDADAVEHVALARLGAPTSASARLPWAPSRVTLLGLAWAVLLVAALVS